MFGSLVQLSLVLLGVFGGGGDCVYRGDAFYYRTKLAVILIKQC